jgi:hypothetical protein
MRLQMGETRVSDRTWDADEKGDRLAGLPVVLVVDDDADVLESLVELLRRDYRVMSTILTRPS